MKRADRPSETGPFKVDQIKPGDRYELSNGHAIYCAPTGRDGSRATIFGAEVIDSDPAVEEAGVDTGFALSDNTLRAPDVAVGPISAGPGWAKDGPPALALEYAGSGQDEKDLRVKIDDLLEAGTRYIWVVRLVGPRRVEVYRPGQPMQLAKPGDVLEAPGVLRNPIPVEALYDREAAHQLTLRNLLQREGYDSVDAVREEGRSEGLSEGLSEGRSEGRVATLRTAIFEALAAREVSVDDEQTRRIRECTDEVRLTNWFRQALRATSARDIE